MLRYQDVLPMQAPRWIVHLQPRGETVHQRLKLLREAKGISQTEMARELGWDQSMVSRYEKTTIPPDDYLELAEALLGAPRLSLREMAISDELRRRNRKEFDVPGPAIAIPDEPGMYEVIEEVIAFDDLEDAKRALRLFRTNPTLRDQFARFVDEALAEHAPHIDEGTRARVIDGAQAIAAEVQASQQCAPTETTDHKSRNH